MKHHPSRTLRRSKINVAIKSNVRHLQHRSPADWEQAALADKQRIEKIQQTIDERVQDLRVKVEAVRQRINETKAQVRAVREQAYNLRKVAIKPSIQRPKEVKMENE